MSRGYGLHKSMSALRKKELMDIWERLCRKATELERADLIAKYQFPADAGYRRIDKATTPFSYELRSLLSQRGLDENAY